MKFITTARFERAYRSLPREVQKRVQVCLLKMAQNCRHPSLGSKKVQGTNDIWEARVTLDYRLTFNLIDDYSVLRNVGRHDPTLKRP